MIGLLPGLPPLMNIPIYATDGTVVDVSPPSYPELDSHGLLRAPLMSLTPGYENRGRPHVSSRECSVRKGTRRWGATWIVLTSHYYLLALFFFF